MKNPASLILISIICLAAISMPANSQSFDRITYPVDVNNRLLAFPFAGGLDAPQFSYADLNLDGQPDLFVFDRVGNIAIPFIYDGEGISYHPDWTIQQAYPKLQLWSLLRDYNGDGIADLFASTNQPGIQGVDVYYGTDAGGYVAFERKHFNEGDYDLLYIPVSNIITPLYVGWGDVPAIDDIDMDGDLDILAFEPGGKFVHFFRNRTLEEGYGLDTFAFVLEEYCWGRFLENEFNEQIVLSDDPELCASSNSPPGISPRHAGSTLFTFDADDDGDLDILVGDLGTPEIKFLRNGGAPGADWMTEVINDFPQENVPVNIPVFASSFILDINQDGLDDLIASSNNPNFSENVNVAWYYENTGTPSAAHFELRKTNFLIDEMLDFGSSADPEFLDYNADGLLDIVVGTTGKYNNGSREARLVLLENTGTAEAPAFRIADEDWLSFSQYVSVPTWSFSPAVGDVDGDGDDDLVVGELDGQLFFVENVAGKGMPMAFANPVYPYMDISVGVASTPVLFDLNGDGLQDLIIGERTGNNDNTGRCSNLNYFENQGSPGAPYFDPDPRSAPNTQCLGRVIFNAIPALREYSNPDLIRTKDGVRLISGSDQGPIFLFSGLEGNVYGSFTRLDDQFGNIREGFRTAPALADIDSDGLFEVLTGNLRGGLAFHQTDLEVLQTAVSEAYPDADAISYSNPVSNAIQIFGDWTDCRIAVYSATGQLFYQEKGVDLPSGVAAGTWPPGFYLLSVTDQEGNTFTGPVIKYHE